MEALYLHPIDQVMKIDLLRGQTQVSVTVPVTVHHEQVDDLSDVADLQRTFIAELNMFVSDLDDKMKSLLHGDHDESGVVVIAPAAGPSSVDTGVQSGDTIRAINGTPLQSASQLQATVRRLKSGDAVVLQVERGGKLQYLAFEID
jgi:serine protease Do